ncbi:MAG: Archease [Nitrospira sp.]|nr:archease [Nitrospira sp.]ULA58078.1 MAG: Archease [Nitrospira sp.]
MPGTFRFLDEIAVADMAFEAEGDSLPALFDAATQALIQSLADPATVTQTWRQTIDMEESDIDTLLFEWLNRLVYLKDAQAVVFHHATLAVRAMPDHSAWHLQAELVGAPVDQTTQDLRSDVKGVTKHLYAVTQTGTGWKARVVLDV